jgi:beta propeller repeat protein/parallel beta-helix repeat protein
VWISKSIIFLAISIFLLNLIYSPASAKEITVSNNGSDADFKSIQEAVNNSSSGDTVIVMPGTYSENINVNVTSLTLRSESKNPGVLVKSLDANESVFLITASNVTLSGFNIIGARGNYTYYPAGICLRNARNCRIKGNILFENYLGVCLVNADQNTVSENFLFNSSISLVEGSNLNNLTDNTLEEGPISLLNADYNKISENFLFNNSISLDGSSRNNLTNNTIENGSILLAPWASGNFISKNKISNGQGISIACCGGGDIISDNTIFNCSSGVSTYDHGLNISNNRIIECYHGIDIDQSSGTEIYNNTILNCSVGISLENSDGVEILNNLIISSKVCGIYIPDPESDEQIYNNYFNNTINVRLESDRENLWNNTHTLGTNIIGGPYLGGNFWAKPDGIGFSQTCTDSDGDWICDSPYTINESNFDFLPLASISRMKRLPVANFSANPVQGLAPLSVQFTDFSQHSLVWNWDFDNDGVSDSTEKDPIYEYEAPGSYTVNLTVSNMNGMASKTQEIIVHGAEVLPAVEFSTNTTSGQAPLSVLFIDLSQNVTKRVWDFNDDGITDSTNKTTTYTYVFPGAYTVNLTVSNSKGTVSKQFSITVSPAQHVDGQLVLTEYQITNSKSQKYQPAIYGDKIVWVDDRNGNKNIYMYDLSTFKETQITNIESDELSPDIYGDRIVWTDFRNGNEDIYMYNLSTKEETQITTNGSALNPKIYEDKVVWEDSRNGDNNSKSDIYMYNFSTFQKTQITTCGTASGPSIYDSRIVWTDLRNGNEDIYMYNLSTKEETQINTNESGQGCPVIYGDKIAWVDSRNRYPNVYMYNISTSKETQIAINESFSTDLGIYGDKIVWLENSPGSVYLYDLSTSKEVQITTNANEVSKKIYSNRIVWIDSRNRESDIYMCVFSEKENNYSF